MNKSNRKGAERLAVKGGGPDLKEGAKGNFFEGQKGSVVRS